MRSFEDAPRVFDIRGMTMVNETRDRYERHMRSWGAAETTIKARLRVCDVLGKRNPDLTQITSDDLTGWLAGAVLKPASRATYFGNARALFGWMLEEGMIEVDPTVGLKRPRQPKGQPKPLSVHEERRVMAAAHGHTRTWLQLALLAGLRAHEIAKIRGEDVQEDYVFVNGKGAVEAYIPTNPIMWEIAQTYPRSGWWFPSHAHDGHVSADTVTIMVGRLFRDVGIRNGSIHRARHSYATRLLRTGANIKTVKELMRHSSLATTDRYCAVDEDEMRAAINMLGAA